MGRIAARRHAQAVFQIALERNELEKWRVDLNTMASILSEPEIMAILENPKVRFEQKVRLINRCLPEVSQLALNLAYLLVAKGRLKFLTQIASEYERLVDAHEGLERAELITATPMDEEIKENILNRLVAITGNKIKLSTRVDPGIIGGFIVRIGDRLIDGSVRNRLEALRESLTRS